MLVFIPAESQSAAKLSNARWIPDSVATGFAISNCGKLIRLASFFDPIQVDNKEEKKQNAPLLDFYVNMETFACLPFIQPQNSSRHHGMTE